MPFVFILTCRCCDTPTTVACTTQHCKMPTAGEETRIGTPRRVTKPKNCRTTNPNSGDHQPDVWQAAVFFSSQSRPFVLVFFFLVARAFGFVDALEAVMTATQKESLPYGRRPAIKFASGEEGPRSILVGAT